jgi:dihydroorotate dehydrogenase
LIFRLLFVPMDAERAHHLSFSALRILDSIPLLGRVLRVICARGTTRPATVLGLPFPNRIGLAAGFDKNGVGIRALSALGFGHIEVGTITAHAQPGNERPRLFRLRDNLALLNRMGFNNDGSRQASFNIAAERKKLAALPQRLRPIVGINIGKTKVVEAADAVADYAASTRVLAPLGRLPGHQCQLAEHPGSAGPAVGEQPRTDHRRRPGHRRRGGERVRGRTLGHVPLLVKIAPDLADDDVIEICDLALRSGVDGLITTNTTIDRSVLVRDRGEVRDRRSGRRDLRTASGRAITRGAAAGQGAVGDALTVISVGGVADAKDARARVAAGADLVQVYSEMIYSGTVLPRPRHPRPRIEPSAHSGYWRRLTCGLGMRRGRSWMLRMIA